MKYEPTPGFVVLCLAVAVVLIAYHAPQWIVSFGAGAVIGSIVVYAVLWTRWLVKP